MVIGESAFGNGWQLGTARTIRKRSVQWRGRGLAPGVNPDQRSAVINAISDQ
jgi:hypothetical protein